MFKFIDPKVMDVIKKLNIEIVDLDTYEERTKYNDTYGKSFVFKKILKLMNYNTCGVYDPVTDLVGLNISKLTFILCNTPKTINGTLLHELGHWTGAPKRLNRNNIKNCKNYLEGNDFYRNTEEEDKTEEHVADLFMLKMAKYLDIYNREFFENYYDFRQKGANKKIARKEADEAFQWVMSKIEKTTV
jgi:hypothetical protein